MFAGVEAVHCRIPIFYCYETINSFHCSENNGVCCNADLKWQWHVSLLFERCTGTWFAKGETRRRINHKSFDPWLFSCYKEGSTGSHTATSVTRNPRIALGGDVGAGCWISSFKYQRNRLKAGFTQCCIERLIRDRRDSLTCRHYKYMRFHWFPC